MRIGWIGLGKLGLPCALALERYGKHELIGYDSDESALDVVRRNLAPPRVEAGLTDLLRETEMTVASSVAQVVRETDDLVFVAVPTPHGPEFGGETPMPDWRSDFDYTALREVVRAVATAADELDKRVTVVVISTALPGTMDVEIMPLLGSNTELIYNPFFIAMGTTVHDYLHPEFVLLGLGETVDPVNIVDLYADLVPDVPIVTMGLREAELTKVAYNTFISMKIVFANTLMEICSKMDMNVDLVTKALSFANRRVTSPAYLRGGMGDGGACHPRDNIAMSWLAEQLNLSSDLFDFVSTAREAQSEWLAEQVTSLVRTYELPLVILGKSYKPGSDLTYGSPALLLAHQLEQAGVSVTKHWDPYVDDDQAVPTEVAVYVIATQHPEFADFAFPPGSVVLDPFRYVKTTDVKLLGDPGVLVCRLGGGNRGVW